MATNDPFVMEAWGKAQNAEGKVRMLSDMTAEATKAMDVGMDKMGSLRTRRCVCVCVYVRVCVCVCAC